MKRALIILILLLPFQLQAQLTDPHILVHFHPQILTPEDSLRDGHIGRRLNITDNTLLIWVDLDPDMFFTHDTRFILISEQGVQVEEGGWWPVLNGKRLFGTADQNFAMISPLDIRPIDGSLPFDHKIKVHIHPQPLHSDDVLSDGPLERAILLEDETLLIWVDLLPEAFFAHPTVYVLISRNHTREFSGQWWPRLNGRRILYGEQNRIGILSPFRLSRSLASRNR